MINIAEILQNVPIGTKLYSPICGNIILKKLDSDIITCQTDNSYIVKFNTYGQWYSAECWNNNSECMLFPSKYMRDWNKLNWKKGDVLKRGKDFCIFKEWVNDIIDCKGYEYYYFHCEYYKNHLRGYNSSIKSGITDEWVLAGKNDTKTFIAEIEKRYGCSIVTEGDTETIKTCDFYKADKNAFPKQIDWEERRYELAKSAMISILSCPTITSLTNEEMAHSAIVMTDLIIEELKNK